MRKIIPVVCAFATDMNVSGLHRLMRSCRYWGWPLEIINSPWLGWCGRLKKVLSNRDWLLGSGYSHLIHVDAYDVVAMGPPDELSYKLSLYNDPHLLIGAEHGCWPDGDRRERFGEIQSHWWFPHSQYVIDLEREIPSQLLDVHDHEDDQRHLSNLFLAGHDWISIDRGCHIIQSFAFCHPHENFFEKNTSGRWRNKLTNSYPLFWHGNGRTDGGWLWDSV